MKIGVTYIAKELSNLNIEQLTKDHESEVAERVRHDHSREIWIIEKGGCPLFTPPHAGTWHIKLVLKIKYVLFTLKLGLLRVLKLTLIPLALQFLISKQCLF